MCIAIQNAGRATVFFSMSGHVNSWSAMFFVPVWRAGSRADFDMASYEGEGANIAKLERIATAGFTDEELESMKEHSLKARRAQYEALKAEFESPALEAECGISHPSETV